MLFKDRTQLCGVTNHVVVVWVRQVVEGNVHRTGNVSLGNARDGDAASAVEAAVASHIDNGTLGDSVLVVFHALLHIGERTNNVEVFIDFEGASLFARLHRARFDGVFLGLPTSDASIHDMHASIPIKDLEHKPNAGRAVEALRVVKDNVVGVANAESFHRFLKLGFGGKRFQKLSLGSAKLKKVQVLGIGKSFLCVNHDKQKKTFKNSFFAFFLGVMCRVVSRIFTEPRRLNTHSVDTRPAGNSRNKHSLGLEA